ncbi:MAG: AAA family ATPase [Candidatus Pacebacteria bacterium]|nr:AAA family ATPase [Candidatus Paceibacterota bacterium]
MSGIEAIRLKNLRALSDTGFVDLKPITLLVGKNSVGKSTFARVFPLLRQSVEENRRAPLLWWGKYVDFGTFEDAVSRASSKRDMHFAFRFVVDTRRSPTDSPSRQAFRLAKDTTFDVEVAIEESEGNTFVSHVNIRAFDLSCDIALQPNGHIEKISCGSATWIRAALPASADILPIGHTGEVFPNIHFYRRVKQKDSEQESFRPIDILGARLAGMIRGYSHGNTTQSKLSEIAAEIPIGPVDDVLQAVKNIPGPYTWRRSTTSFTAQHPGFRELREWAFVSRAGNLLRYFNEELRLFALGVRYIEPIRATAQRYYRSQELSIDEIDSKGANIAMLLHSMAAHELQAFNNWLQLNLGIGVVARKDGGHVSLKVVTGADQKETNLADVGFGLSQVLPIATQIWSSTSPFRKRRLGRANYPTCFVVEQPELHLHPAFQARIADLFVGAISTYGSHAQKELRIVAETHSSSLVNRIGELVADGKVDKNDVQVILFDQSPDTFETVVRIAEFDEDGVLQNWPLGFFSGTSE